MSLFSEALPIDGNMVYSVSTEPTVEPITTTELKTFARIDGSENRALLEQSITLKMDYWPGEAIELPRPPLISITSVSTLSEADVATTYSSSNYYIITEAIPGKLLLKIGVTAPTNTARDYGGFQIIYKAGYGTSATDVMKIELLEKNHHQKQEHFLIYLGCIIYEL
jgi:hypothetical protein